MDSGIDFYIVLDEILNSLRKPTEQQKDKKADPKQELLRRQVITPTRHANTLTRHVITSTRPSLSDIAYTKFNYLIHK